MSQVFVIQLNNINSDMEKCLKMGETPCFLNVQYLSGFLHIQENKLYQPAPSYSNPYLYTLWEGLDKWVFFPLSCKFMSTDSENVYCMATDNMLHAETICPSMLLRGPQKIKRISRNRLNKSYAWEYQLCDALVLIQKRTSPSLSTMKAQKRTQRKEFQCHSPSEQDEKTLT